MPVALVVGAIAEESVSRAACDSVRDELFCNQCNVDFPDLAIVVPVVYWRFVQSPSPSCPPALMQAWYSSVFPVALVPATYAAGLRCVGVGRKYGFGCLQCIQDCCLLSGL